MKEKKKSNKFLTFIQIILVAIMIYSAYQIGSYYYFNWRNTQQLREAMEIAEVSEKKFEKVPEKEETEEERKLRLDNMAKEVIKSLKEKGEDVVAYVKFPEARISYPVAYKKEDNDFYLFRDLKKNYSSSGTVFLNGYNEPNFDDMNTTLFGHHMLYGTDLLEPMFTDLLKFDKAENVDPSKEYFVEIYTEEGYSKYQIFSGYFSDAYDNYIFSNMDEEGWVNYMTQRQARSSQQFLYNKGFSKESKILTLSTCDYGDTAVGADGRFVMHAMLVE